MTKINQYKDILSKNMSYKPKSLISLLQELLTEKRYHHVLRVRDKVLELGHAFELSEEELIQVEKVALFHDLAKGMDNDELLIYAKEYKIDLGKVPPPIYHAIVGAWMMKYFFDIEDVSLLDAVYYHTTGSEKLLDNKIGLILFLADYLEPGRAFEKSHIEKHIPKDMLRAVREIVKGKIIFVIKRNRIIDRESIAFYHSLLGK